MRKLNLKEGFTLFEVLMVIGLISIMIPVLFAIVFATLRQQSRVYALRALKREGDFAINAIRSTVRDEAVYVIDTASSSTYNQLCATAGTSSNNASIFLDRQGQWFSYQMNGTKLASSSAALSNQDLSSTNVSVSNFSMTCTRPGSFTAPLVAVSFDVQYGTQAHAPKLNYTTRFKMRNAQ